jgi:hypothetical protein
MESEYFDAESLQNIDTRAAARSYIDEVVSLSSPSEILRYVQSFFLPIHQHHVRRRKQRGGDDDDVAVYKFLALCDSVHDASRIEVVSTARVMEIMNMTEADLPQGFASSDLSNEERVVDFLRTRKRLRFGDLTVRNPLNKADLRLARYESEDGSSSAKIAAYMHRHLRDKSTSTNVRLVEVSVAAVYYAVHGARKLQLQLRQVLLLAHTMRARFGARCVFQPDSLHPIIKFITAVCLISEEFYEKYAIDMDYSTEKYASEIQDIVRRAGGGAETTWKLELSDSNVFDAQSTDARIEVDKRPTGCVYRPDFGVQVELRSLSDDGRVEVAYTNRGGATTVTSVTKRSARILTSTEAVFASIIHEVGDAETNLALRRAGDWAQVEHCRKYDKVFVTSDVLAALYAFYRRVRFLLLRVQTLQTYEHYYSILGSG